MAIYFLFLYILFSLTFSLRYYFFIWMPIHLLLVCLFNWCQKWLHSFHHDDDHYWLDWSFSKWMCYVTHWTGDKSILFCIQHKIICIFDGIESTSAIKETHLWSVFQPNVAQISTLLQIFWFVFVFFCSTSTMRLLSVHKINIRHAMFFCSLLELYWILKLGYRDNTCRQLMSALYIFQINVKCSKSVLWVKFFVFGKLDFFFM